MVWKALTDAKEFGIWFGLQVEGAFKARTKTRGLIVPTAVDAEVATAQRAHAGRSVELRISRIEPERMFSFRWHPYAVDSILDYAEEPSTLVTFALEPHGADTLLTLTESVFDRIPLPRRTEAVKSHDDGWNRHIRLLEKYLAHAY